MLNGPSFLFSSTHSILQDGSREIVGLLAIAVDFVELDVGEEKEKLVFLVPVKGGWPIVGSVSLQLFACTTLLSCVLRTDGSDGTHPRLPCVIRGCCPFRASSFRSGSCTHSIRRSTHASSSCVRSS